MPKVANLGEHTFTCAICKETFEIGRPNEEAIAEFEEKYGFSIDSVPVDVVCDTCADMLDKWISSGAPEFHSTVQ